MKQGKKIKTLRDKIEVEKLIGLFSIKAGGCNIQEMGCPCNTCFHSIEDVDFQHICWLVLLGLRGDYDSKAIITDIEKELGK